MRRAAAGLILALILTHPAFCAGTLVTDRAGLFTQEELWALDTRAGEISDALSMDLAILTIDDAEGKSSMDYADDYYDQSGLGRGEDFSGALFLIDMDNRVAYVSTCGKMIDYLTDDRIEAILDDAYAGLSQADYYAAGSAFLEGAYSYVKAGLEDGQYRYDTDTGEVLPGTVTGPRVTLGQALVFLLIALLSGGIACGAVSARYKMRAGTYRYPFAEKGALALQSSRDDFINRTVVRHRIQPPPGSGGSSGGGRSSVHSSSSGRSHGGGGRSF